MNTKAFQKAEKLDEICRNCKEYDSDMEIGGMYGFCRHAQSIGKSGRSIVKEANQYCDEVN